MALGLMVTSVWLYIEFYYYQNWTVKNYWNKTIKTQNFKLEVSYAALKSYSIQSPFIC
jgi:hypothetical protein